MLKALWKDEAGQTLVEYALILGVIAILVLAIIKDIGVKAAQKLQQVQALI